ncbi:MAG: PAS domain S-box protein [Methanobacterium sp.]
MTRSGIKEDKPSEKLLKESEERNRRWFDDDLTGDFIAEINGKISECNPAFAEIYGFDNCDMACKYDFSQFNPEDWIELIAHLKKKHKIKDHQTWHLRPDGKKIHVVANFVGIFNDDELVQVKGYVFDDTERKKSEELLQRSEEKYRRWFEDDLTGDFIASVEGKIMECNPAFAGIYGFDDCKMAFKWDISQSNPFDWPYIVTRLKKERKIQGFQSWQRRYDGMRIHVIANVVGIFNDSNELIQVKGYVFDDTERKKAEDELNRSKNQIKEILDSIQDGFIALDRCWHFIYVNGSAAEFFGFEEDDIIGQNIWERFPEFIGSKFENAFRKTLENKDIHHFETPSWRKKDKWFDISVYPSTDGITVYLRDITERKKLEEKLKQK